MSRSRPRQSYRNLLRFYRFALPYWKTVLLALVAMVVYSAVGFNVVLLIKPFVSSFEKRQRPEAAEKAGQEHVRLDARGDPALWEGVLKRGRRLEGEGAAAAPAEGVRAAPSSRSGALLERIDEARSRIKAWLLNAGPVRRLREWLWPGADLKRVVLVLLVVVGPLFLVAGFLQEYAQGRVVWSVLADLRMAVFDRLSTLSLGYFSGQRTGELVSRLTNDIARSQTALKIIFGKLVLQPLMLVFFLAGAIWMSPVLTVVVVITMPVLALVMWRFGSRIRRYATKTLEKLADVTDSVTQMLAGMRVVKAFNMEAAEREEFRERNRAQVRRAFKLVRVNALASLAPEFFLGVVVTSVMLLVADHLVAAGRLSLADVLAFGAYLGLVAGRVKRIVKAYNDLQGSMAGVNRIFELIDLEPDIADSPDAIDIDGVREGVGFDHVWFAYDEQPVLKDITLFVPCGKVYAIVGETGAGKSTMLDLIPRFYDPQRGRVTIDGFDVRRITRSSLMRQIAIVSQHPFLFNRSIAENIRYGRPDATDEEVRRAAKAANIHEFIISLPDGYETMAGEAGQRFSGGQRQCITIARAILKDAPILILDEATSSLDAESEMLVQTALRNLMENRTTFVIAHRLSTVRNADCIVVLKDGRIVEQGTHADLLQRGGEYQRLYRLQFGSFESDALPSVENEI